MRVKGRSESPKIVASVDLSVQVSPNLFLLSRDIAFALRAVDEAVLSR